MPTIQVPILFDVDNLELPLSLFGEEGANFFHHHTEFTIASNANGLTISDMAAIHVGDADDTTPEKIFFCSSKRDLDTLCDKIAHSIIEGTLVNANFATKAVPIGGKATRTVFDADMGSGTLGAQMAKIACIHLVGHPLAQALFTNEQQIDDALLEQPYSDAAGEGANYQSNNDDGASKYMKSDGTTEITYTPSYYHTKLARQLGLLLGGKASGANDLNAGETGVAGVLKSTGKSNPQLKAIFEQLMNVTGRSNGISTAKEVASDNTKTTTAPLPFESGDVLVFYIRAKVKLEVETAVMGAGAVTLVDGGGAAIASDSDFATGTGSSVSTISSSFPGTATNDYEANKYNWMGNAGKSDPVFNEKISNLLDGDVLDCHTMRISLQLHG
jgi:hypothetical protein